MSVRKAIIPAAGLGTRFLPATKAMPKEMLPIVDKPTIQFIVEEALASGIEQLLIVTGKGKRAIEDHFDRAFELEQRLREQQRDELLRQITVTANIDVHYIRQKEARGLGDAIYCARHFIGNEPFAVLLGDDIMEGTVPATQQLIAHYERTHCPTIAVQDVDRADVHRYGIVQHATPLSPTCYDVHELIEKPQVTDSTLAIVGRYVLTPEIFPLLRALPPGRNGEIQLTDALAQLPQLHAVLVETERYDVGDPYGHLTTSLRFALRDPSLRAPLLAFMETIVNEK